MLSPRIASEVEAALLRVLETVQRQPAGASTPVWRRLYLCFLGHGVALSGGSRALLTGDATLALVGGHVDGGLYADYFAHSGYFEEVVLVMDCGRERAEMLLPPPSLPSMPRLTPGQPSAKRLTLYGPGLDGSVTRLIPALVEGLSGAAADANGDVTVSSLHQHLALQLPSGGLQAEFTQGDWVLTRIEPQEGEAIFHLSSILVGIDAVLDGGLAIFDSVPDRLTLRLNPGVHVIDLPAAGIRTTFTLPQRGGVRVLLSWALRDRRVLVAGTGSDDDLSARERWMSEALGRALAVAGFSLVTGGWQGTDDVVAAAYAERVSLESIPPDRWLTQVVARGRRPQFEGGRVVATEREFQFPMDLVEAVILIGGRGGTRAFFEYAREGSKRVYPVPGTGGEAKAAFEQLLSGGGPEAQALRRLDVPLDSPNAAQRLARKLVEMLLAISSFPYPVLVGEIDGGTVHFAFQSEPGAVLGRVLRLVTDNYLGLPEAIEAAVQNLGTRPRSMIVCGVGPVVGRRLKLTNSPWEIDGPETARRAGLAQGLLLNDFEAQVFSLPAIREDWTRPIGPLPFGGEGPHLTLGPGIGLGIAALVEAEGRFTAVSSEACHIDFGPVWPDEFALWPHLERAHGRVTSESVLGEAGLARVHRARMKALGRPDPHLKPPEVITAALADPKGEAADSVRLYWRIVARFAGDMAITFVATGGVTLSGGVLPRVVDFLDDSAFRAAFEAKAPVDGLARRTPTRLIIRSNTVLIGMAAIASRPEHYAIDYAYRGWV